ncbi:MAG: FecR domain-containing protein, partial [Terriglobales bacterium]
MTKRYLQYVSLALVMACSPEAVAQTRPASASVPASQTRPASAQTAAPAGPRAGSITALLPVARITRGTGRTRSVVEAKKGDPVVFNDLLQTEKSGRARITLNDQSILSLGSQAELRITRHDARTQQTALQLGYGRVRAEVASVTRDGGRFELRTPTAVAGVIGTDFGADSSLPGVTSFICITGIVEVANSDAKVPGTVPCPAGSTTTVATGLPPTAPKPATQQQIQQLIQDTEPAIISSLSPASALTGTEVATAASGSKMIGINAVSISGSGVTVALQDTPTESEANVKIAVDASAPAGTRTLTFTRANGQTTAAVFSILAPPGKGADGTTTLEALKKFYLEILEQERQSAITGVNALGIGLQQSAADTLLAIQNENNKLQPPLEIASIEKDVQADVAPMIQAMTAAGATINEDTAAAARQLEALFAEAEKRIADSNATPTDDAKLKLAKDIFDRVNGPLMARFKGTQDGLGGTAKSINARFLQTMARWVENFRVEAARQRAVPIPKVDADERTYDLGLVASFDAARSTPTLGASIASYSWVLCDPAYRPQQVGVPLPPSDTRCQPVAGYASNASDFKFPTCELNARDHIARVTVTDTNNRSTAMDVRVRILPPQYEGPGPRLRSLANAYEQLQLNSFLRFFDESFSGLTELQESIRRTFTSLASMNINLRFSQAAMGCNEATVRADWEQAYTFKEDLTCANVPAGSLCQRLVFKQQEQLTVRMKRIPGKNWYITEFQGDNGTVQGTPPGPIQRDTSLPDLRISSLTPTTAVATGSAAAKAEGVIGIAPGVNAFAALVENTGSADLQTSVKVRFVARDGNGNQIATDLRELPGPIPVGGSATVVGQMNVPDLGPGVNARIFAVVNPGCVIDEQNCDGGNAALLDIIIGIVDLQVTGFTPVGTLVATQPGQVDVQIKNLGSRTSNATSSNLRMLFDTQVTGSGGIPAIAPGATVTTPLQFIAPNLVGVQPITIAIAPSSPGEFVPANDNLSSSLTLVAAVVDLRTTALAITSASPFLSGQTITVSMNVENVGNRPSVATNAIACLLTSTTAGTQSFAGAPLAPIAGGATAIGVTYSFVLPPNFSGNNTLTCGVSQDPFEAAGLVADNKTTIPMTVAPNVDLQIVNVPAVTGADQMGGSSSVTFGVKNFGLDTAPSGWNVVLTIDGNPVGSVVAPSALPGLATAPVTINYTNPQVAPAPADVNVPASLQVNANAAIVETNITNNTFSASLRLVDFTLSPAVAGGTAVVGRTLNLAPAITVLPVTYPLNFTVNYANLPSGVTGSGSPFGQDLSGTPGATGSFSVGASGTVDGVVRLMTGSISLNVVPEISMSLGTAFGSLTSGGSPQNLQMNVTGGVYPVTVSLGALPTGVTTSSPVSVVLSGPGAVTWSVSASLAASPGAFNIVILATDNGVSATGTPGGNVSFVVPGVVNGQANYIISSVTLAAPHTN